MCVSVFSDGFFGYFPLLFCLLSLFALQRGCHSTPSERKGAKSTKCIHRFPVKTRNFFCHTKLIHFFSWLENVGNHPHPFKICKKRNPLHILTSSLPQKRNTQRECLCRKRISTLGEGERDTVEPCNKPPLQRLLIKTNFFSWIFLSSPYPGQKNPYLFIGRGQRLLYLTLPRKPKRFLLPIAVLGYPPPPPTEEDIKSRRFIRMQGSLSRFHRPW